MSKHDTSEGNQSIHRSLNIIEMLMGAPEPLLIKEISDRLGTSLSVTHSVIKTLISRGYVSHTGPRKGYVIGPMISNLCKQMSSEQQLLDISRPLLKELTESCDQETTNLGYFFDFSVEILLTHLSSKQLSLGLPPRNSTNLHATSIGKLLLAYMSPKEYLKWKTMNSKLLPDTDKTITDHAELEKHLDIIRERGYSENIEESEEGVYLIASPIFNYNGKIVAGIGVGLPISRYSEEKKARYVEEVMKAARHISKKLGHAGS